jgi:RNase P/RNase MRP subunit POP5
MDNWGKIDRLRRRHEIKFLREVYAWHYGEVRKIKAIVLEYGPGAAVNQMPLFFSQENLNAILFSNYNSIGNFEANRVYNTLLSRKNIIGFVSQLIQGVVSRIARNRLVAAEIRGIAQNQREEVRRYLSESMTANLGAREIAKGLTAKFSRDRALRIVRTETTYIWNTASLEGAKATGLRVKKIWLSTNDARTRDIHREANGQEVGIDESFNVAGVQMQMPGDPAGGAKNVVNCRCTVTYSRE